MVENLLRVNGLSCEQSVRLYRGCYSGITQRPEFMSTYHKLVYCLNDLHVPLQKLKHVTVLWRYQLWYIYLQFISVNTTDGDNIMHTTNLPPHVGILFCLWLCLQVNGKDGTCCNISLCSHASIRLVDEQIPRQYDFSMVLAPYRSFQGNFVIVRGCDSKSTVQMVTFAI